MLNTIEEDRFCELYCDTYNREWEGAMQEEISISEGELNLSRRTADALGERRSWLVRKMRDAKTSEERYRLLEQKLESVTKAQEKKLMEYYRDKRRHAKLVEEYRIESKKRRAEARNRFRNMTPGQRLDIAKRYLRDGIGTVECRLYIQKAEQVRARMEARRKEKEARRRGFQRAGYAEGRKISYE